MRTAVRRLVVLAALLVAALPASPAAASAGESATCLSTFLPVAQSTTDARSNFVLRNTGAAVCQLPAHPLVRLSRDGRRLPVRVQYDLDAAAVHVVPAGALVSFRATVAGRRCRPADTVRVLLSGDSVVSFRGPTVPACRGGRLSISAYRVAMPAAH